MGHRDDRDPHPGHPSDLGGVHPARVHHDLGLDVPAFRAHAAHSLVIDLDAGHAGVREHVAAALTRAVGRIAAAAADTAEGRVAWAMRAHPEMVAGNRRDVTALMRAVPGLIAKDGFEAVQVAALPDGTAIGVKIADGSDRARLPVTVAALALAGVAPDLLAPFEEAGTARGLTVAGELRDALSTTTDDKERL